MNIQTKIDFHFVKCRFSEMPCINGTAEVHLTFRRSELFTIFALVLRSAGSCLCPGSHTFFTCLFPGAFLPSENHFFLDLMMSDAEIRDSEADIGPYFFSYASITISRATSITSLIFSELSMAICRTFAYLPRLTTSDVAILSFMADCPPWPRLKPLRLGSGAG